jgi:hypothetical protein
MSEPVAQPGLEQRSYMTTIHLELICSKRAVGPGFKSQQAHFFSYVTLK